VNRWGEASEVASVVASVGISEAPYSFFLGATPTALLFAARGRKPCWVFPQHTGGEFVEGLWERDVVELFLTLPAGNGGEESYLEVNLSPSGDYWFSAFERYRSRAHASPQVLEHSAPKQVAEGEPAAEDAEWHNGISFALPLPLTRVSPCEANICALSGSNPRTFYTWHEAPPGHAPDFHLASLRRPVYSVRDHSVRDHLVGR
jgi:hypothetical protein